MRTRDAGFIAASGGGVIVPFRSTAFIAPLLNVPVPFHACCWCSQRFLGALVGAPLLVLALIGATVIAAGADGAMVAIDAAGEVVAFAVGAVVTFAVGAVVAFTPIGAVVMGAAVVVAFVPVEAIVEGAADADEVAFATAGAVIMGAAAGVDGAGVGAAVSMGAVVTGAVVGHCPMVYPGNASMLLTSIRRVTPFTQM